MSHSLQVRLKKSEGSLVRLLGVVTRRGYEVLAVNAELASDGKVFDVRLRFGPIYADGKPGYRPPDVLVRMIAKLYDVEKVELLERAPSNGKG